MIPLSCRLALVLGINRLIDPSGAGRVLWTLFFFSISRILQLLEGSCDREEGVINLLQPEASPPIMPAHHTETWPGFLLLCKLAVEIIRMMCEQEGPKRIQKNGSSSVYLFFFSLCLIVQCHDMAWLMLMKSRSLFFKHLYGLTHCMRENIFKLEIVYDMAVRRVTSPLFDLSYKTRWGDRWIPVLFMHLMGDRECLGIWQGRGGGGIAQAWSCLILLQKTRSLPLRMWTLTDHDLGDYLSIFVFMISCLWLLVHGVLMNAFMQYSCTCK